MPDGAGRLVLVATPIGNLGDLSPRAAQALADADLVCCEDTRRTRVLLAHAGVHARALIAVHEHNEQRQAAAIVERIGRGQTVALVSDAGTPGVSDPGTAVVSAAAAAGACVSVVPGPNAAVAALVVSGLPTDRFCFEGFLPRRGSARRQRLAALAVDSRTTMLHEAPSRLAGTLHDIAAALGADRPVAVVRELTKIHEEVWRGTAADAAAVFTERTDRGEMRGEVVVVVGGARVPDDAAPDEVVLDALERLMAGGSSVRDAASEVATELGVPRRHAYELAVGIGASRRQGGRAPA